MISPAVDAVGARNLKLCCADLYQSDWARLLLGESFHPGGLGLTRRLGELLNVSRDYRVLDAASGPGSSALFLAREFDCDVIGLEYGEESARRANADTQQHAAREHVHFGCGDAERLPFPDQSFDRIICECAFCTFPDKPTAAAEFYRVLRPGGLIGITDVIREGPLPEALDPVLAWIACIGDAQPVAGYQLFLEQVGFQIDLVESHDQALHEIVDKAMMRLLAAEIMVRMGKLDLQVSELERAKMLVQLAKRTVTSGNIGYSLITGVRPQ